MGNYNNYNGGFDFSRPPGGGFGFNGMSPNEYNYRLAEARNKEKRSLFKNAAKLGALLLLYEFFNSLYLDLFYILCYVKYHGGISLDMNTVKLYLRDEQTELISGSAFSMTANLFVVVLSLISLVIVAELVMKTGLRSMLKPYKGFIKQGVSVTPMCLTLNMFISYVIAVFVSVMSESGVTVPEADFTIKQPSTYAVVIQLVYVCIIAPVVEEMIYRGLVIKLLSPYGKGLAVFFSALIFGLMHGNIPQAASAFGAGLIYAATAVYFGSVAPTIVIHILNNCFASITDIGDALGVSWAYDLYLALNIIIMFAGIYALFVKLRGLINGIRSSEPECALSSSQRYFAVFTNVFMLIYFLLILWGYVKSFLMYNS